jgi:membrane associated rhomboid family serine protease
MRVTYYIVAANIIAFILQLSIAGFTELFALTPVLAVNGAYWQFITYMFMHGGFGHIAINMFVLFIFGIQFENAIGSRRFLTLYLASGVFSSLFYLLLTGESFIPMLGASGAVFAVITAFAVKFPNTIIFIGFFFPLPAKYAVIMFAILEFFSGAFDLQMGIANFGHLGGIIAGFLIMYYWRDRDKHRKAPEFQGLEFIWE